MYISPSVVILMFGVFSVFFILFFVCIVFQLIPLHFLTLNVSLCASIIIVPDVYKLLK
jgi:hypothetical protein